MRGGVYDRVFNFCPVACDVCVCECVRFANTLTVCDSVSTR